MTNDSYIMGFVLHNLNLKYRHHGCRKRGDRGHEPPTFQRLVANCSFLCNLVVVLESFENAKMDRKTRVSGDFGRPKF